METGIAIGRFARRAERLDLGRFGRLHADLIADHVLPKRDARGRFTRDLIKNERIALVELTKTPTTRTPTGSTGFLHVVEGRPRMAAGGEVHHLHPTDLALADRALQRGILPIETPVEPDSGKDAGLANVPHRGDGSVPMRIERFFAEKGFARVGAGPCDFAMRIGGRGNHHGIGLATAGDLPEGARDSGAVACGQGARRRFVRVENGRQPGRGVRGNALRVHPSDESRTDERYIQHGTGTRSGVDGCGGGHVGMVLAGVPGESGHRTSPETAARFRGKGLMLDCVGMKPASPTF